MFRSTITTTAAYMPIGEGCPKTFWKGHPRPLIFVRHFRTQQLSVRDGCPGTLPQTGGGVQIVTGIRSQSDDRYGARLGDEDRNSRRSRRPPDEEGNVFRRGKLREPAIAERRSRNEDATDCWRKFPRRAAVFWLGECVGYNWRSWPGDYLEKGPAR